MNKSIIMVAGHGRCGSSLLMQMLSSAGVPTTGEWPAFEDNRTAVNDVDQDWYEKQNGKAVKILDPVKTSNWCQGPHKIIWLERDHFEQAKSQCKFLTYTTGLKTDNRLIKKFAKNYQKERKKTLRLLKFLNNGPIKIIRFEKLINEPTNTAREIAEYLGLAKITIPNMAKCVISRSAKCKPDMNIEIYLYQQSSVSTMKMK